MIKLEYDSDKSDEGNLVHAYLHAVKGDNKPTLCYIPVNMGIEKLFDCPVTYTAVDDKFRFTGGYQDVEMDLPKERKVWKI